MTMARSDPAAVAEALARNSLFAVLSPEDRLEVARRMRERRFRSNEPIFRQDDPAEHVYVVRSGEVKVTLTDEHGREALLAILRDGEMFGDLGLFDGAPRSATVTAVRETVCLTLARPDFFDVLQRDARAARELLALLARTIRRISAHVEDLIFLDVPSRVAKSLLDLTGVNGVDVLDLTQDDLAATVGASRVSVNRVLADLERRGLLAVDRRRIKVLDRAKLAEEIKY